MSSSELGLSDDDMPTGELPSREEIKRAQAEQVEIGPGLILERGRTRLVFCEGDSDDLHFGRFVRLPLCSWPTNPSDKDDCGTEYIRYLLLSGFKVIRNADPKESNP